MNLTDMLREKTEKRSLLLTQYQLPKREKILICINIHDTSIRNALLEGISVLPASFIVSGEGDTIHAKNIAYAKNITDIDASSIDALVCDSDAEKIEFYMKAGVVPIISNLNYLGKILSEFSPSRGEGNAYLYEDNNYWSAYYALIRYLENHRFPYDNRNLVKNVV